MRIKKCYAFANRSRIAEVGDFVIMADSLYGREVLDLDIVIFGYEKERRDILEANLHVCLGRDTPVRITQHEMNRQHMILTQPESPCAVFIVIDEANALLYAEKAAAWGEDFPVVMVATHPQYAIEGIRQKVRHYILFPLEREEIAEALKRAGVMT